ERITGGFKIVSGLFTRKELFARDQKIQSITWSDNLLKRIPGFFDIKIVQAGAAKVDNNQKITIPGASANIVKDIIYKIFKFSIPDKRRANSVHIAYFTRYMIIISILMIPAGVWLWYFHMYSEALFLLGLYILIVGIRYAKYKKTAYYVDEFLCMLWGGAFGQKNAVFPMHKIQGISWSQSPFQRKKGLVTLRFY